MAASPAGMLTGMFLYCSHCHPRPILLHELGGSSESWAKVVSRLASDRRVIAIDLCCGGRSEKPVGAFTLTDIADDLDAFLRALHPAR